MTNLEKLKQDMQGWTAEMMWAALRPLQCPESISALDRCENDCRDCWIEFWNILQLRY